MAKLRPRARIVRTIGDQLISGPEAALIELVKNAYDADSPYVKIKIIPPQNGDWENEPSWIIVSDAGHGMTSNDLLDKWLEPATSDKVTRKTSPIKHRKMLGAKGVGRFATARLGKRLELESTTLTADHTLETSLMKVDWQQFEQAKYLDEVDIEITPTIAAEKPGVTLTISELKDTWSQKKLENLIKELRRMASPLSSQDSDFKIFLDISAFNKDTHNFDGHDLLLNPFEKNSPRSPEQVITPLSIESLFHYKLEGEFSADGGFIGTFLNDRGDRVQHPLHLPASKLYPEEDSCGPVKIRLNIYDRESDAIQSLFQGLGFGAMGRMESRKLLNENIGVGIYRDGFRIRPYGDAETDWLELERMRVQNPSKKLGLNQLAGIVTIDDENLSGLIERSSREGLEHNGAFARLKRQIAELLSHIESIRQDFRERAGLSRKPIGSTNNVHSSSTMEATAKAIAELPTIYRDKIEKAFIKETTALKTAIEDLETYQQALISHSSLGLVITQVLHDGRRYLSDISTRSEEIVKDSPRLLEESTFGEYIRANLPENAKNILSSAGGLSSLFKSLNPVSGKKRGAPSKQDIVGTINRCLKLFTKDFKTEKINVKFDPASKNLFFLGHDGDLMAALLNLLDNATHWLSTSTSDNRTITIQTKEQDKYLQILVSNNGPTIDERYIPKLFNAGFSLKPEGSGIGLAIAREALRASKADLAFDDSAEETTFIIEMVAIKND
ncbi:Signal transduction histidine kinase [Pseudomonas sp. NFACC24-1]|uniref:sensor histidine kinase n=1 Tax=Pseudomonas sp. NFACC24-1 TaxID=1566189 RepID=UPI0008E7D9A9|nr:sensor histidine kinase [Pseudomonas sp. NFACC24-1]SFN61882.1 Signal transduction histidine kinase [Pseudomonas sp. NFACC24-1]